ncbi:MAG: T9SS type A sorting domain-containing protein [Bacteroidales bacterium]|nr:T9SS type A sorting domain-containing protein [Bacteroidales bacterium]
MKQNIQTCIIVVFLALEAPAQTYEPVIASDTISWDITWQEMFGNVLRNLYSLENGDSIYHYLYFQGFYPYAEYVGKIREDRNTGRIWYTPQNYTEEYLIMDLTLSIGENFELPVFNTNTPVEVVDVYYVDQRKTIEFDYQTQWNEPLRFIEGVGSTNILYIGAEPDWSFLNCKFDQGELVYVNNNILFDGCMPEPSSMAEKDELQNEISIYPNPSTGTLEINLSTDHDAHISILDLYGRILKQVYFQNFPNRINLHDFPNGIYFIRAEAAES